MLCPQENQRLEEELSDLKVKLAEAETSVNKLEADLSQLLLHKVALHNTQLLTTTQKDFSTHTLTHIYWCWVSPVIAGKSLIEFSVSSGVSICGLRTFSRSCLQLPSINSSVWSPDFLYNQLELSV